MYTLICNHNILEHRREAKIHTKHCGSVNVILLNFIVTPMVFNSKLLYFEVHNIKMISKMFTNAKWTV